VVRNRPCIEHPPLDQLYSILARILRMFVSVKHQFRKGAAMKFYQSLTMVMTLSVVCLIGTSSLGQPVNQIRTDKKEIRQDRRELATTVSSYNQLSENIDRWVEAHLASNDRLADQLQSKIMKLIDQDIRDSEKSDQRAEIERLRSRKEVTQTQPGTHDRRDDRLDLRDDRRDSRQADALVRSKKLLAENIRQADAFSNKYRLMGDYLELLRRETGKTKAELAEDRRELREDRVGR
jgi:hypothetical protein